MLLSWCLITFATGGVSDSRPTPADLLTGGEEAARSDAFGFHLSELYFDEIVADLDRSARTGAPAEDRFFLTVGAVLLNSYLIEDEILFSQPVQVIEPSGQDLSVFVEALFKRRRAWSNERTFSAATHCFEVLHPLELDYEVKIGFAGGDSDVTGLAGASDAYAELLVGVPLLDSGPINPRNPRSDRSTLNLDLLAGFVTDHEAEEVNGYYGLGPSMAFGINASSAEHSRRIELELGIYAGYVSIPDLESRFGSDAVVETRQGFPDYRLEFMPIARMEAHIPVGKRLFLTLSGRFGTQWGSDDFKVTPWNVGLGITIPFALLTESVAEWSE